MSCTVWIIDHTNGTFYMHYRPYMTAIIGISFALLTRNETTYAQLYEILGGCVHLGFESFMTILVGIRYVISSFRFYFKVLSIKNLMQSFCFHYIRHFTGYRRTISLMIHDARVGGNKTNTTSLTIGNHTTEHTLTQLVRFLLTEVICVMCVNFTSSNAMNFF